MALDLKIWFKHQWSKYIPIILLFLYAAVSTNIMAEENGATAAMSDYLIVMFKGMKPYEKNDSIKNMIGFHLPVYYLLFHAYISWIISYFPLRDMGNYGKVLMIKNKSRGKWWINKCVWGICAVLSCYMTGYIVFAIVGLLRGNLSMRIDGEMFKLITGNVIDESNLGDINIHFLLITCVILPVLMSMGISMIQMVLSLITKPLYGQMMVLGMLVISAYYCNKCLPGNYLMVLRNDIVIKGSGIHSYMGIGISIVMIIIGMTAGFQIMKKKDII